MGKTEKTLLSVYSLHDVFIRKVKMLKNSMFELRELKESHAE
ncbi:rCG46615, partial [Rattus norvegicus]